MVTMLSSTSTIFTLVLAAIFPSSNGDKFTLSKIVAVSFCLIGVVSIESFSLLKTNRWWPLIVSQIMVTIDDVKGPKMSNGALLALMSAFFYASYLVLVKRKSDTEEKVDIPLFFGKYSECHRLWLQSKPNWIGQFQVLWDCGIYCWCGRYFSYWILRKSKYSNCPIVANS